LWKFPSLPYKDHTPLSFDSCASDIIPSAALWS
jgi:hypothetical protein